MASLAQINVKFSADLKQFSSEMQSALREMEQFGSKLQSVGKSMSTYITAPLLVAGGAAVHFASDYEESLNKVEASFKGSSDQVKAFAKTSLTSFGIAEGTALDLASTYGDMSTSMGLSTDAAAKMSTQLVGLAGDLSSFKNIGIEQANTALKGVFTGETESLKTLGVVVTEANLQAFAYSEGIQKNIKDMSQAEKVNLRYAFVLNATKNAQGDFAKTSGGAANQMRIFQESMKQLAQQFGSIILPVFTSVVNGLNQMITYFSGLSEETKTVIVVVAAIAAAIGPLVLAIGTVIAIMPTLIAGFTALTGPVGLTVLALSAVAAVVVTQWKPIKKILIDIANYFIDLYNNSTVFRIAVEGILLSFKNMWAGVKFIFNALVSAGKFVVSELFNGFSTLGKLIKAALTFDLKGIREALSSGFSGSQKNATKFFNSLKDESKNSASEISKNIGNAVSNVLSNGKVAKIAIPKEAVDAKGVESAVEEGVVNGAAKGAVKIGDSLKKGTIAFYESQIAKLQEQQKEVATTEAAYYTLGNSIAAIQSKIDAIAAPKLEPVDLSSAGFEGFQKAVIKTAYTTDEMMNRITASMKRGKDNLTAEQAVIIETTASFNEQFSSAWLSSLQNFSVGFGEIIGQFAAGGASLSNIGNLFLTSLADMAIQVGKIAITTGLAIAGIKKALQSLNPVVAIAAGIALVAIGTIAKSSLADAGGGNTPKFTNGGIVGGSSYYGDKILARVNSKELITNTDQQKRIWNAMNSGGNSAAVGGFVASTRLSGSDLLLLIERAQALKDRIG